MRGGREREEEEQESKRREEREGGAGGGQIGCQDSEAEKVMKTCRDEVVRLRDWLD